MLDPDREEMTNEKMAESSDLTLAFPISLGTDSTNYLGTVPQAQGWGSSKGRGLHCGERDHLPGRATLNILTFSRCQLELRCRERSARLWPSRTIPHMLN